MVTKQVEDRGSYINSLVDKRVNGIKVTEICRSESPDCECTELYVLLENDRRFYKAAGQFWLHPASKG